KYDPNDILDGKPKNTMGVSWKPSADGELITKTGITAFGELNQATKDVNWKEGSYNPDDKKITWSIFANYLENEINGLKIVDTPQGNQTIDSDTEVKVYKLTINSDGTYEEEEFTNFTKNISGNILTVTINENRTS